MERIFIVEDDKEISGAIEAHLRQWGFNAKSAVNFQQVDMEIEAFEPHLVLLDISLPFFNGYHWCTQLRRNSKVPIIFVSSTSDNMNMVMAMNMGGDDFIAKPFDLAVLTAKVQALLRRSYAFSKQMSCLSCGGMVLRLDDFVLEYQESKMELTKNEFKILEILMQNPDKVISRDNIISVLWDNDAFVDDNTLTVNMTRIRKKLEELGLKDRLVTKKGAGYMLKGE